LRQAGIDGSESYQKICDFIHLQNWTFQKLKTFLLGQCFTNKIFWIKKE
jgi:hypothetical protein